MQSGFLPLEEPARKRAGLLAPRPWADCDTCGEDWRAYCEAWDRAVGPKKDEAYRYVGMVREYRGHQAAESLKRNIELVKRDWAGGIGDRAQIPSMLARPQDMPKPPRGWKRK